MSCVFGDIRQNGYVVRDIEAAMKHWAEVLGVGPFFYMPHIEAETFVYRGKPSGVDMSIALANSGDLQIELIQQHNDEPSLYKDFLDAGREGLQHVSSWVADIQPEIDRLTAAGHVIAQEGTLAGGIRFVYFDTEQHPQSGRYSPAGIASFRLSITCELSTSPYDVSAFAFVAAAVGIEGAQQSVRDAGARRIEQALKVLAIGCAVAVVVDSVAANLRR